MYDVVIIGSGPAGIQASLYLHRFGYRILVIGQSSTALQGASMIENYYGITPMSGAELQEKGILHAKELGIEIVEDEVVAVEQEVSYVVKTVTNRYPTKVILFANGKPRKKIRGIPLNRYEGLGVSYCAICDGFFYRNQTIGILGSGEFMEHELEVLERFTKSIIIFTNGEMYQGTTDKVVVTEKIVDLTGEDGLDLVVTETGSYAVSGLFVAYGSASALDFARHIGLELNEDNIKVDQNYMTNLPGVFAAGDCIGGVLQIAKAVADGMHAAFGIKKYLSKIERA